MVKKLLTFLIFILIFILLIAFFKNSSVKYEKILLDYDKLNLQPKKNELDIHYVDGEILFLSLIDMTFGEFGKTTSIITYNFKSKSNTIIDFNEKKRIINYIIFNNKIYYITIENQGNYVKWNLFVSDLQFSNKKLLKEGQVKSALMSPYLLINDNNIYIASLNKDYYDISLISENDEFTSLLSLNAEYEQILDLEKISIDNQYIYYISATSSQQGLYKYDYQKNTINTIFSSSNKDELIFEYEIYDEFYLVNVVKNSGSNLIYLYSDGTIIQRDKDLILTFANKILDDKLLTHNSDNSFRLFDSIGNEQKNITFDELNIYPKYVIYNNNIVIQDISNELYLYSILK